MQSLRGYIQRPRNRPRYASSDISKFYRFFGWHLASHHNKSYVSFKVTIYFRWSQSIVFFLLLLSLFRHRGKRKASKQKSFSLTNTPTDIALDKINANCIWMMKWRTSYLRAAQSNSLMISHICTCWFQSIFSGNSFMLQNASKCSIAANCCNGVVIVFRS